VSTSVENVVRLGSSLVPPHDLEAERAILSPVLIGEEAAIALLPESRAFFSPAHRCLVEAVHAVRARGLAVDAETVVSSLRDSGRLDHPVGGASYVASLITDVPATVHLESYARLITTRWRMRQAIATAQRIAAEGYTGVGDPDAWLESIADQLREASSGSQPRPRIEWQDGFDIAAPLPEQTWRIAELQVAEGRPTTFLGYGGSGKTTAVMSAALAYAAGARVWGQFSTGRGGPVLHWNWDQGGHATRMHYQRLGRGMGVDLLDVGRNLRLVSRPPLTLLHPNAEAVMMRECEGVHVAVIDAFRGAVAGADENDSSIRAYLDLLATVSERTGCAFVLLHHTRKLPADRSAVDPRELARGSGAILDGSGAMWLLEGMEGPRKVRHVRAHEMATTGLVEPFYVELVRPTLDSARVEWRAPEAVEESSATSDEAYADRVLAYLEANPGATKSMVRSACRGVGAVVVQATLDALEQTGRVRVDRAAHSHRLYRNHNATQGDGYPA
jgi:hypothetical protein